jgi:hypothetical protein
MQRMLVASEQRALAELGAAQQEEHDTTAGASSATKSDEGLAGNPAKTELVARGRVTRGEDRHAPKTGVDGASARPTPDEVASFGILEILAGDRSGARSGISAFAVERGPSAMGSMFGQTLDDAAGNGGLGLSSAGIGGGGHGAGVTLGSIGNLGQVGGVGPSGQGFGRGHCGPCVGGTHMTRSPSLMVGATQVNGRLPPESIQRVVRQGFGRLRACYERGLQRRPDLEGRIAVKFVIDREGNVGLASTAERSLDDDAVASCVGKAFESMSFPKPVGGIVTVVYPVVFTSTSP